MHLLCVALRRAGDEPFKQITWEGVGFFCTVRGDSRVNDECRIMLVPAGGGGSDLTCHAVEAFKGTGFRDVWVEVDQRFTVGAILRFHTEEVDDVWQTY